MQRPPLEQLESGIVERPLDLDGLPENLLRSAKHAAELDRLMLVEAGLAHQLGRDCLRHGARLMPAGFPVVLATGIDRAHRTVRPQSDAIGDDLALGDGGAEAPRGADEHPAVGRPAEAASGGVRFHERLDKHGHGCLGGVQLVVVHVAAHARRPQRRPARAHGRHERRLVGHAQKAHELAGEVGACAILDQRRGAHCAERPRCFALCLPSCQQRLEHGGRDRLLVKSQPDLDR